MRFGSVGGGGRYDGLVGRFRGEPVPATGFSIGVSRLQAALAPVGKLDVKPELGPVVVTVFDHDRIADYQRMVRRLRNANIRAELYLGNPKNSASRSNMPTSATRPCVVIQGGDEKAQRRSADQGPDRGREGSGSDQGRDEYLRRQRPGAVRRAGSKLVEGGARGAGVDMKCSSLTRQRRSEQRAQLDRHTSEKSSVRDAGTAALAPIEFRDHLLDAALRDNRSICV